MYWFYPIFAFFMKFVFIFFLYYFIYKITRLIYMDIKTITDGEDAKRLVPHLKLISGLKEIYPLMKSQTIIGRGAFCDVVLADHHVSSKHAEIKRILDAQGVFKFYIVDLKSANGTYVNGMKISNQMLLREKDILTLGPITLEFSEGGPKYD